MNVFISWSGDTSKAVAEALREWLPYVINAVRPWMSAADIEKGSRWSADLADQLNETRAGVICLTQDNLEAPWVLFEAGALSKRLHRAFVCPYLFDVEPQDLKGPLVQFQGARSNREDTLQLLHTMRRALKVKSLTEKQLDTAFETWWPALEEKLKAVPRNKTNKVPRRPEREVLEELLELTRTQVRQNLGVLPSAKREGEPIRWPQLLKVMEGGPRLLKEYIRQSLKPLRDTDHVDLTAVTTGIEKSATKIDSEWHQLISKSAALHRRIELLASQELEGIQSTLMYMAECGVEEDLAVLRYLRKGRSSRSNDIEQLFHTAESEIMKRCI